MTAVTEVMVLAMVAGIAVLLVRFFSNYLHFRKLELAIPGPPSPFLLGNALDFAVVTPNNVMKTVLRMIGGRKEMCRFSVFNNLMVSVQDPEQLEEVFRCKKFDDKSIFFYNLLHVVAKKGLVQMNGPEWKAHRRWLEPGFNQNLLNTFGDVFSGEAKAYVDRVEVDKEVDVVEDLRKASVRNFIRTSTSKDSSEYDDVAMEGCEFLELFLRTVNNRSFNPALWSDRVFAVTPLGKKVQETKKTIDNLCNGFIVKKRAELKSHNNELDYERARKTLLDIMLEVPDPSTGMPEQVEDDVISDEIKTLFAANVETTVATLSWVLKALSLLPEVQEQAQAELFSVFGASDRAVSIQDLPKLEYISRVIKEVLRMFPAIPFFGRQCYEETKLCGHTIPAGTTIFVNAFAAHYDPKHWDRPEVFDPDRFLPERSKGRHPYAYLAFSLGPRRCVGYNYAMMNMTIFVATVLRAFKVLPVGEHKDLKSLADNMSFALTSYLLGGMRVRFQRRVAEST